MSKRLRVGVFGLGRRWQRYKLALVGPHSIVDVRAVLDPSPRRTVRVARALQCEAVEGAEDLIDRSDVDALLLLARPWHGLWPLERASQAGKPVLFAAPLTDDDHAEEWLAKFPGQKPPIMAALGGGLTPAAGRLRTLLERHLGPARLVHFAAAINRRATSEQLLAARLLLHALHICGELLPGDPESISTAAPAGSGVVNLTLTFSGGRAALVALTDGGGARARVAVTAEKGTAVACLPRRLLWKDSAGDHSLRLPRQPALNAVLARFADAVRVGRAPRPSFEDACRALSRVRAARRSHAEGRAVRFADA
jgi:predicted dehydrogenase